MLPRFFSVSQKNFLNCPSFVTIQPFFQRNFLAAVTFRGHLDFIMKAKKIESFLYNLNRSRD